MGQRIYHNKAIRNARVHRPISVRVFTWLAVIAVAGVLLSCSFVIAARQHFQAISAGYQTEELRKQATQQEEQLRQLELEYSRAASPFEIERRAGELGLIRPEGKPGPQQSTPPKAARAVSRKNSKSDTSNHKADE